jgi:hypothetical protein
MARPTRIDWGRASRGAISYAQVHHVLLVYGRVGEGHDRSPSDRSAAAKALTESLGGTMEAFYEQTAIVQQAATARNAYKPPTA